ncbi:MAG TPA: hypothetical protein VN772_02305 [Solirubrobacteraceae bacterium]|nr:hypothetical protein [Solirubrobacteraceae bacterium]
MEGTMGRMRTKGVGLAAGIRRSAVTGAALAAAALLGGLLAAAPASAALRHDLQRFSDCPLTDPTVVKCVYSTTTSGEFVIGNSAVPINQTVTIQAGLKPLGILVPAADGNTLSKTPLQVPGGLVGIELLGNFTEVTATAELAGQAQISTSVALPLKVKLDNLALGGGCYLGSESEPLSLHLIYGETSPPPPNKPISGKVVITTKDGQILTLAGTLVDNSFAAPGANGCTLLPLVGDLAVNTKEGLPAAAGKNTAIMSGVTEEVSSSEVTAVLPLPELGRCQKLEGVLEGGPHGKFSNSSCTILSGGSGKYEFVPGPGAKDKFSGVTKGVTLESVGKVTVKCAASSSTGEYTGAKTETASITLTGCTTGPKTKSVSCQSSGAAAGEIKSEPLAGSIDFIKENEVPEKPEVGLDLKAASGSNLVAFECAGVSTSVSGSVIAPLTAVDKMATSFKVAAKESGGIQSFEAFEEGAKDTLSLGAEAAGLTASSTQTNEEPLEVKAEA